MQNLVFFSHLQAPFLCCQQNLVLSTTWLVQRMQKIFKMLQPTFPGLTWMLGQRARELMALDESADVPRLSKEDHWRYLS